MLAQRLTENGYKWDNKESWQHGNLRIVPRIHFQRVEVKMPTDPAYILLDTRGKEQEVVEYAKLVALLSSLGLLDGLGGDGPPPKRGKHESTMLNELGYTEEQARRVFELNQTREDEELIGP